MRVLFLAVDPLGVVVVGAVTVGLGGDPRPVFLVAGLTVVLAAAGGWLAGLRAHSSRARSAARERVAGTGLRW